MVRTNQGGSVLSFIIVGTVLVALLVGGAYGVRELLNSWEDAPSSSGGTAITPAPDSSENDSNQDKKAAADKKAIEEEAKKDQQKSEQDKKQRDAKDKKEAEKAKKEKSDVAKKDKRSSAPVAAPDEATPTSGQTSEKVKKLPETGPAETFASVIGAGALTAAVSAYIISRRKVTS